MSKANKPLTNPKTVVPKEYYDFFDVFLKEALDTVTEHSKYNYRIKLLERHKNLGHSPLQGMSQAQLEFVKKSLKRIYQGK